MIEKDHKSFVISGDLSDLISISEAANYTPYSAEYLSFRARTGHLRAVKIARNWLTTREWVLSYLTKQRHKHLKSSKKEVVV